jgi:hypothetical protein
MLVHGTKQKERPLGWVADFCPICRVPRACRLFRIGMASHLYFVTIGDGRLVGFTIECSDCKTRRGTDDSQYANIAKHETKDLAALIAETMPDMPERLGFRLDLEKTLRDAPDKIASSTRRELLAEPFTVLNPEFEKRFAESEFDRPATIGCMGTLVLLVLAIVIPIYTPQVHQQKALLVLFSLFGAGTIYTSVQLLLVPGRAMRGEILPKLSRALTPLNPTREELQAMIVRCKERGMEIGKRLKLDALWHYMHPRQ